MPEANIPAIKRKAAGTSNMPPEMANPLVQPPAMPAAYSSKMAPKKPKTQRFQVCGPKMRFHWESLLAASFLPHFKDLTGRGSKHAAEEYADQQNDAPGDAGRHDKVESRCY